MAGEGSIPAAYTRYVEAERRAERFAGPRGALAAGEVTDRLFVRAEEATRLAVEAAKRAAGFFRPTRRTEVVWVDGDSELAVGIAAVRVETGRGFVLVTIPVRCDQTGPAEVHVTFAVGEPGRPAGLYAATQRRPRGPALVVDTWGESLVAFAWQVLLGLVTGLAGATGKDARGNRLVPVELEVTGDGLAIVPMARHRFSGSAGLTLTRT
ncbi:MAG TPA: hypothetical protein VLB86_00485 [Gaiellaceae bacterium]|nr:hypothetical protein [Gaiellaceae bacterium]